MARWHGNAEPLVGTARWRRASRGIAQFLDDARPGTYPQRERMACRHGNAALQVGTAAQSAAKPRDRPVPGWCPSRHVPLAGKGWRTRKGTPTSRSAPLRKAQRNRAVAHFLDDARLGTYPYGKGWRTRKGTPTSRSAPLREAQRNRVKTTSWMTPVSARTPTGKGWRTRKGTPTSRSAPLRKAQRNRGSPTSWMTPVSARTPSGERMAHTQGNADLQVGTAARSAAKGVYHAAVRIDAERRGSGREANHPERGVLPGRPRQSGETHERRPAGRLHAPYTKKPARWRVTRGATIAAPRAVPVACDRGQVIVSSTPLIEVTVIVLVASSRVPITVTSMPRCSSAASFVMSRRWKPSGLARATLSPPFRQAVAQPLWASLPAFE